MGTKSSDNHVFLDLSSISISAYMIVEKPRTISSLQIKKNTGRSPEVFKVLSFHPKPPPPPKQQKQQQKSSTAILLRSFLQTRLEAVLAR